MYWRTRSTYKTYAAPWMKDLDTVALQRDRYQLSFIYVKQKKAELSVGKWETK